MVDPSRVWKPSLFFRARSFLAPSFAKPSVFPLRLTIAVTLEPPTPTVDLRFPDTRLSHVEVCELESSVSADTASFGRIAAFEIGLVDREELVRVSGDLFERLGSARTGGKNYRRTGDGDEQTSLVFDSPTARDREGYRASFHEVDDPRSLAARTVKKMSVWDMILPLLEPPLSFDFEHFVGLPTDLYAFQPDGIRFLATNQSALLGDEMGTGKTVQTIVALRLLFQNGTIRSALIVVPLAMLLNWDRELEKWAPTLTGVTVVHGPKEQRVAKWERPAHVWIATYGTVRADIDFVLERCSFDLVVLDEIQNIKNPGAQQSRAAKRLPRKWAWGLSGTPIENRLEDLVSIYGFLKPGLLQAEGLTPLAARNAIKPWFLRRRKRDVLKDLPDKKAFDQWIALEGAQRAAYEQAEEQGRVYLRELGDEVTVTHVLELLTRLKQLCNRDPKTGQSAKLEFLIDKLDEAVAADSKVLVFSQYKSEGTDFLTEQLFRFRPVVITGDRTAQERARAVDTFQNDDRCKLLLATPKAGGVGLNLVAGNYVFHFDHWWNPATVRQAEDRVHRIGQTKDVFVYHLWTEGTVEDRIRGILERKRKLYDDVIDELSNVQSSGLSEAELFELFDLKKPKKERSRRKGADTPDQVLERLLELSDREFEDAVRHFYECLGFSGRLTPSSRDAGVDVVIQRPTPGGLEKCAVQCKRYRRENSVGVHFARELLGVITSDLSFAKGILVTTSSFTADCRNFAAKHGRLELIDGYRLSRLIVDAGLEL